MAAEGKELVERSYRRSVGVFRVGATFLLVAVLVAFAHPTPLSVTAGFVVTALGEAVRFWAAGHLLKTQELVTSGPYRYTRNPLYLGRLLIFTGLCVMCLLPYGANWIVLVSGYAIFFGYYLPRKERVEPARLREVHGEAFERYHRAVPALFPSPRPFPDASGLGWSSDRMFRNREHWMVVGILAITLLLLWRAYPAPMPEAPATLTAPRTPQTGRAPRASRARGGRYFPWGTSGTWTTSVFCEATIHHLPSRFAKTWVRMPFRGERGFPSRPMSPVSSQETWATATSRLRNRTLVSVVARRLSFMRVS